MKLVQVHTGVTVAVFREVAESIADYEVYKIYGDIEYFGTIILEGSEIVGLPAASYRAERLSNSRVRYTSDELINTLDPAWLAQCGADAVVHFEVVQLIPGNAFFTRVKNNKFPSPIPRPLIANMLGFRADDPTRFEHPDARAIITFPAEWTHVSIEGNVFPVELLRVLTPHGLIVDYAGMREIVIHEQ